jgi:hypothetical protein
MAADLLAVFQRDLGWHRKASTQIRKPPNSLVALANRDVVFDLPLLSTWKDVDGCIHCVLPSYGHGYISSDQLKSDWRVLVLCWQAYVFNRVPRGTKFLLSVVYPDHTTNTEIGDEYFDVVQKMVAAVAETDRGRPYNVCSRCRKLDACPEARSFFDGATAFGIPGVDPKNAVTALVLERMQIKAKLSALKVADKRVKDEIVKSMYEDSKIKLANGATIKLDPAPYTTYPDHDGLHKYLVSMGLWKSSYGKIDATAVAGDLPAMPPSAQEVVKSYARESQHEPRISEAVLEFQHSVTSPFLGGATLRGPKAV